MFKLGQKGVSLPIVLAISALVTANVYYFLAIDKKTKTENVRVAARINELGEKNRLISYLANYAVCSGVAANANTGAPADWRNFGNQDIGALTNSTTPALTQLVTGSSPTPTPFLKNGEFYIGKTHKLTKFYFENIGGAVPSLSYVLTVVYEIPRAAVTDTSNTGVAGLLNKRTTIIKIPLFVELSSNRVTRCYARTESKVAGLSGTDIETAVKNACWPQKTSPSSPADDIPNRNTAGSLANLVSNDGNYTANSYLICRHDTQEVKLSDYVAPGASGRVLNGINIGNVAPVRRNTQEFTNTGMNGPLINCNISSPEQQFAYTVTGSEVKCRTTSQCPAGTMMILNGSTISCSQSCGAGALHQSMNASGVPNCVQITGSSCPAGTYATGIDSNGNPTGCASLIYKNYYCSANYYAVAFDASNASNPITCAPYSKAKSCASYTRYTYVTSLTSHPTVGCMNYLN